MTLPLTVPPQIGHQTFLYSPLVTDLDTLDAHVAVLGIPYGDPYTIDEVTNDQTKAPDAARSRPTPFSFESLPAKTKPCPSALGGPGSSIEFGTTHICSRGMPAFAKTSATNSLTGRKRSI